jgi:hypothetical protein
MGLRRALTQSARPGNRALNQDCALPYKSWGYYPRARRAREKREERRRRVETVETHIFQKISSFSFQRFLPFHFTAYPPAHFTSSRTLRAFSLMLEPQ